MVRNMVWPENIRFPQVFGGNDSRICETVPPAPKYEIWVMDSSTHRGLGLGRAVILRVTMRISSIMHDIWIIRWRMAIPFLIIRHRPTEYMTDAIIMYVWTLCPPVRGHEYGINSNPASFITYISASSTESYFGILYHANASPNVDIMVEHIQKHNVLMEMYLIFLQVLNDT